MSRNTIVLKGLDTSRYEEGRASVAIMPGYLIQTHTDGTLKPHATAGGTFPGAKVAIEDGLIGMTVTGYNPIPRTTTGYAIGDLVRYHIIKPGDQVQLVLKAGENAAIGSKLSSNGDGTMQVVAGTEGVEFEALEALDLSAGGSVDTLIPARRL